jgi:hypothetical protein
MISAKTFEQNFSEIFISALTITWFIVLPTYLWMTVDNTVSDARTFILAVKSGDIKLVKELLGKGVDVNTLDYNGDSALIIATQKHNCVLIDLLLEAGASVWQEDREGRIARDYVIHYGTIYMDGKEYSDVLGLNYLDRLDISYKIYNYVTDFELDYNMCQIVANYLHCRKNDLHDY